MNCLLIPSALLASALCPTPILATQWLHLRTPQFDLYTTNPERESRELVDLLEGTQTFMDSVPFLRTSTHQKAVRTPVRIVALSSLDEYAHFRLGPTAFGYFRHSRLGNYICLQDIKPEHRQAAVHEYIHLVLRQADLALPLWLNEGLADLYSSLSLNHLKTEVGAVLPARMRVLDSNPLIDLDKLFAVDHKSPYYTQIDKVAIFYAESWALVHLLALNHDYAPDFPRFVDLISKGLDPSTAFSQIYGRSLANLQAALIAYLPELPVRSVAIKTLYTEQRMIEVVIPSGNDIENEVLPDNYPPVPWHVH